MRAVDHEDETKAQKPQTNELNFIKVDINKIRKEMEKLLLPLSPCFKCDNFVKTKAHDRNQCALYHHERLKSKDLPEGATKWESSDEEEINERTEEKQTNPPINNWRENQWERKGFASFKTNDKRRMRCNIKQPNVTINEQQIIHAEKNPVYSKPQFNTFKWNTTEQTKITPNLPTTPPPAQKYENIINFLNKKKRRTICLEGNIGAGKSTILNAIKKLGDGEIVILHEPVNKWKEAQGINLLGLMYERPEVWAPIFQSHALLSLAENHTTHGKMKLMERSIYSTKFIFMELHKKKGNINDIDSNLLNGWFNFLTSNNKMNIDAIIYLRTSPKKAFERIKIRNRPEEKHITEKYIEEVHSMYENWLVKGNSGWPCQTIIINADNTIEETMEKLNQEIVFIP